MKIFLPRLRNNDPDPEDAFTVVPDKELSPEAASELEAMRHQCATSGPSRPKCDDCPGRSSPLCCWEID